MKPKKEKGKGKFQNLTKYKIVFHVIFMTFSMRTDVEAEEEAGT